MSAMYGSKNKYHLVWNENFVSNPADPDGSADWNVVVCKENKNNELQAYVNDPKNVYVKNNMLYICPTRKLLDNGQFEYSSAHLSTKGKREYLYGRFEARIKIPYGSGLIPFFKLRSDEEIYGEWPNGGQIDILMLPTRTPHKHYSSIHYTNELDGVRTHCFEQGAYTFEDGFASSDMFHDYACEWTPDGFRFFIDGEPFFESNVGEPFNHPMYIEIGLSIGGNLAGPPAITTSFSDQNALIIDYIRVMTKEEYYPRTYGEKRKLVAVCGSWEDAENFNIFLRALQDPEYNRKYLTAAYTFGVLGTSQEKVDEKRFADFVRYSNPAAIIVFAEMVRDEDIVDRLVSIAHSKNIPVFMFDKPHPDAINVPCNFQNYFEDAVRHIVEFHGIRDVELMAGYRGNEFSDNRERIFKNVLEENNIEIKPNSVHYGGFWDEGAYNTMVKLLSTGYKVPEAIICANDSMVIGVNKALKKYGYSVPEDVKLIGFDGIRETAIHTPSLSTFTPDYSNFVKSFMEYMEKGGEHDFSINGKFLPRESCGCQRCESAEEFAQFVSDLGHDNTDNFRHMYEMSRFVSQSVKCLNFFDALSGLEEYLWLWKDQYYFVGLKGADAKLRVLFSLKDKEYKFDRRYFNIGKALPDMDELLDVNGEFNTILFKQIKVHSDDFVFAATGIKDITLRTEQRFEELVLFTSTVLDSVYNNQNYMKMHKEIEKLSQVDHLTGLYNRRGFLREIERQISLKRNKTMVLSMFSVDMDGLKFINDNYGHATGDAAIQIMAKALLQYAGARGICARYGGDEFAFALLSEDTYPLSLDQVHSSLDELIAAIPESVDLPVKVRASIGYSQHIVDEEFNLDDVVREADKYMYEDKKRRKEQE